VFASDRDFNRSDECLLFGGKADMPFCAAKLIEIDVWRKKQSAEAKWKQ